MEYIKISGTDLNVSNIVLGCMRLQERTQKETDELIKESVEMGINYFDHADIYGGGKCEEIFGTVLKENPYLRDKIYVQTKCGIRKGFFDFSKEHIINSVESSLKRLNTDYIDTLLLHRPDTLCEPEEVCEAFCQLEKQGKVRYFGVSNQNPMQIELLSKFLPQKIVFNQLQLSLKFTPMIDSGLNVNMENEAAVNRDGGILDYCRLKEITIQPWSPFQYGFFEGVFLDNEKFPELNKAVDELCEKYNVSNTAMAIAWILRHPAKMQPIIGTTNLNRVKDIVKASDIKLTRQEWYKLYLSAGNILP